jgi:hypothetical protein
LTVRDRERPDRPPAFGHEVCWGRARLECGLRLLHLRELAPRFNVGRVRAHARVTGGISCGRHRSPHLFQGARGLGLINLREIDAALHLQKLEAKERLASMRLLGSFPAFPGSSFRSAHLYEWLELSSD